MKRFQVLAVILILIAAGFLYGFALPGDTGSGTYSILSRADSDVVLYDMTLTSDSSGDVVLTVPSLYGNLLKVAVDPLAASPSANYDLDLKGVDAVDVLLGNGANLSATVTSSALIMDSTRPMGYPVAGDHTITGADMGASKQTRVFLWVRR